MASIDTRKRANGTTAYRLRWRYGGRRDGAPQTLTYDHQDDAKKMRGAVEARGHLVYDTDPAVLDFSLVTGMRQHTYTAPSFGEVGERYIASRTRASVGTRERYRYIVRNDLAEWVNRPIESITDEDIQGLINRRAESGKSVTAMYDLARSVFKFALAKGMLPQGNPCVLVQPPKKRGRTANFLTVTETALILSVCAADAECRPRSRGLLDLVDAILGTGLRRSEALGLIVGDVHVDDVDDAWIDVEMQLSRKTKKNPEQCRVPVKTDAGQRRIVLDRDTAALFARLVKGKRPDVPVFEDPVYGGWWSQSRVNGAWMRVRQAAQDAGLAKNPRLHDLRHTHAAWLLTDGVPLLAVSRRLGHESIKITADVYGHLLPEGDDVIKHAVSARRSAVAKTKSGGKPGGTSGPANRTDSTAPAARTAPERTTRRKTTTSKV